jgi:integrase
MSLTGATDECLLAVLQKLVFRQGPTLRGYQEWMLAGAIAALPGCSGASIPKLRRLFDELTRIVQVASGLPRLAGDGGLSYLASNGRPEATLRGKCVTVEAARTAVDQARDPAFRYVSGGLGLPLGHVTGQRDVLHRKMRNAYLAGNFDSIWMRALSTERRLMERALSQSEDFDAFVNQLEGVVLAECQDAEAIGWAEFDPMKRGPAILRDVLQRLAGLAKEEPEKVSAGPKADRVQAKPTRFRVITLEEEAAILAATCPHAKYPGKNPLNDSRRQDNQDVMVCLMHLGARINEAQNLRWTDINFAENTILVRRLKRGDECLLIMTNALRTVMERRYKSRVDNWVFPTKSQHTSGNAQWVNAVVKRSGINLEGGKISSHTFRHSCATRLLRAGMDIRKVQVFLGHKNLSSTMVYLHAIPSEVSAQAAAVFNGD